MTSVAAYTKPQRISLKNHPDYTEKWVQTIIAKDATVLGLGELVLLQQERIQPSGGRLDLLFQDDNKRRYEVEIQLGPVDESHIIRTLEYWDIERKRYPQYDHCAVLIAEQITSRFLNIVSLFNGTIPLIAIQMQAYMIGDHLTVIFTTVMDEMTRGLVDEDEIGETTPADRAYWESKGSKATVALADQLLSIVHEFDPALDLKYNKFYIGLAKNGRANNFVSFIPHKKSLLLQPDIDQSDEIDKKIEDVGLEPLEYDKKWGRYRIPLGVEDVKKHGEFLKELIGQAFNSPGRSYLK